MAKSLTRVRSSAWHAPCCQPTQHAAALAGLVCYVAEAALHFRCTVVALRRYNDMTACTSRWQPWLRQLVCSLENQGKG